MRKFIRWPYYTKKKKNLEIVKFGYEIKEKSKRKKKRKKCRAKYRKRIEIY